MIKPSDSNFDLFFYQRIALRALMRFKEIYITAPRAWSKSFIVILGMLLQCIFMPGTKRFICAPMIKQSAKIGKEKLAEIFNLFPLLRKEIVGGELTDLPGNYGRHNCRNKTYLTFFQGCNKYNIFIANGQLTW